MGTAVKASFSHVGLSSRQALEDGGAICLADKGRQLATSSNKHLETDQKLCCCTTTKGTTDVLVFLLLPVEERQSSKTKTTRHNKQTKCMKITGTFTEKRTGLYKRFSKRNKPSKTKVTK